MRPLYPPVVKPHPLPRFHVAGSASHPSNGQQKSAALSYFARAIARWSHAAMHKATGEGSCIRTHLDISCFPLCRNFSDYRCPIDHHDHDRHFARREHRHDDCRSVTAGTATAAAPASAACSRMATSAWSFSISSPRSRATATRSSRRSKTRSAAPTARAPASSIRRSRCSRSSGM